MHIGTHSRHRERNMKRPRFGCTELGVAVDDGGLGGLLIGSSNGCASWRPTGARPPAHLLHPILHPILHPSPSSKLMSPGHRRCFTSPATCWGSTRVAALILHRRITRATAPAKGPGDWIGLTDTRPPSEGRQRTLRRGAADA